MKTAVIVLAWLIATGCYALAQCDLAHKAHAQLENAKVECVHPIDAQTIREVLTYQTGTEEIITCELCKRNLAVRIPLSVTQRSYSPEVKEQILKHNRYVLAVREAIKAAEQVGYKQEIKVSQYQRLYDNVQHVLPAFNRPQATNTYHGAVSRGPNFEIVWDSPYQSGPRPIDLMRASLQHLEHLQHTNMASEANAKLIFKLVSMIEEYDGSRPTAGGSLNNLIPKLSDVEELPPPAPED